MYAPYDHKTFEYDCYAQTPKSSQSEYCICWIHSSDWSFFEYKYKNCNIKFCDSRTRTFD